MSFEDLLITNFNEFQFLFQFNIRVMREYTVLARLLSADDSEKKTTAQKTGIWNEQIVFKGLS